jgi:GntR family transcriptional regulator/MocR family aminotransferase
MFVIDAKSKIPLYEQLYQQIRTHILSGYLHSDTKLPSNRSLSKDLRISRNTVDMAYQQLLSEGYIFAKSRSGYYVEKIQQMPVPIKEFTKVDLPQKIINDTTPRYNLQYGKLSSNIFPLTQWQRLTNECIRSYKEEIANYGSMMGELGLRREVANYLREYRDVKCTVDQIMICSGIQHCLTIICELLKPFTSTIAMEDPGFAGAYYSFKNQNFSVDLIPVDHHGLSVKYLSASKAKAAYVTPSHQFPTGKIMSITRRLHLVDWSHQQDAFIIEDDYSCHLRYDVKPIQALQSLAPDKVIYIGSFSKILSPSLRVAYMVLPDELARYIHQRALFPCFVPFLIQKPLELLLQREYWERHLRKTTRHFKKKHDTLVQCLRREFGDSISISGMNAGLHLFLQVHWPASAEQLITRAQEAGISIHTTGRLWVESRNEQHVHILLGFGGIELDDIPQAIHLLRKAWLDDK